MEQLLLTFLTALGLDLMVGDPRSRWHPVALLGNWAYKVEKGCRWLLGGTITAGALGWLVVNITACVPAYFSTWLVLHFWGTLPAAGMAGIWLYVCIGLRSLWEHARQVRKPLASHNLLKARAALAMIVSRDTAILEVSEIARGAVESLGENLIDAVNSALFFAALGYIIADAPLAAGLTVLLRASNTLDACWGYKNKRYLHFGRVAALMDDVLHFIPARLSLFAIALSARFVGGSIRATLKTGFRHRKDHASPNSPWGMAAFAGALGIRLGGPTVYDGMVANNPYLGEGRKDLNAADIRRAQKLSVAGALIFVVFIFVAGGIFFAIKH